MNRKLQIFISSTFWDLQEERQAAVSAILNAGHIPAGMELFTAGDQSQLDVIKGWIDESDIYMLILGGRYGSIEPESELSYTELEYQYARETGKPLFSVVATEKAIDTKVASSGKSVIETSNGLKLGIFRSVVLNSISRFFDEPKDIKLAVHETIQEFSRKRQLSGWIKADLVQDVQPLHDKIADLQSQVSKLSLELADARLSTESNSHSIKKNEDFEEIKKILKKIKVTIPSNIAKNGEEIERSVYTLLTLNRDLYVKGVSVGQISSERSKWFAGNVYPKLIVHKLMDVERLSGGVTRFSISSRGQEFLARLDKDEET